MSRNLFEVNDIVYLAESAKLGSLESYSVSEIRQNSSGIWYYKISIPQRPPASLATFGDRITLNRSFDFELAESELTTFCAALDLAISYLTNNLSRLNAIKASQCSSSSSSSSSSTNGTDITGVTG